MRLPRPPAALLFWLGLLSPCVATAGEADIGMAGELVRQGQYKQAYDLLAPLEGTQSNNPAFDLLLAEAALETGNAGQAKSLFERALQAQPDSLEAHLGLGRAYLALGEDARALIELESVLNIDGLPPDLHGQAEAYADAAEQLMQGDPLSTNAHAQVGAGHYMPREGRNEGFATLSAGVGLTYQWRDAASINASVLGQHSFYSRSGDTNSYRARIGFNYISGHNQTHFELTSRSRQRPSGASLNDHAASVEWRRGNDADNQFRLGARFSQVNVPDSLVGQLDRNQRAGELKAGIEHALSDGGASISANVLVGREWSRRGGIDGDADFHGVDAELQFTLGASTSLWLGGLWRHNRFSQLRPGDDPSVPVRRRDDLYELFAGLAWQLPHDWSLSPEVLYLRDRGNIASNHYTSTEVTLSLRKDF
jgi:tetratricopeptide (TPR) repeat protein